MNRNKNIDRSDISPFGEELSYLKEVQSLIYDFDTFTHHVGNQSWRSNELSRKINRKGFHRIDKHFLLVNGIKE